MKNKKLNYLFLPIVAMLMLNACATDDIDDAQLEDIVVDAVDEDANTDSQNDNETVTEETTQLIVDWNELWLELDLHTIL